jgi:adenylate cyclase
MPGILLRIYERHQLVYWGEFEGAVELGRQSGTDSPPYAEHQLGASARRVVVAGALEDTISRKHVRIEPASSGRVRLRNLREKLPVRVAERAELAPGGECELDLPCNVLLGKRTVEISAADGANDDINSQTLAHVALPPGASHFVGRSVATLGEAPDLDSLFRWLQAAMGVLHSAAGSSDFLQQAARAVVDLVGLDSCGVLLLENDQWKPAALENVRTVRGDLEWQPSRQVLDQVRRDKKTLWQVPRGSTQAGDSLVGLKALVAAPILNRAGGIVGVLYGDRRLDVRTHSDINRVQAMLVELLACGVAAGLAREEQERAALVAQVRFEQFFTPSLSRQLANRPDLLKGRDTEITMLFCDIRGFSRICERLGAAATSEWISDVLGTLSDCALEHEGVLADYVGDELMAIWGAPEEQPAHAQLACQAALSMLERLPELSGRWQAALKEPLAVGIGINTGMARVGNIGSYRKFKYGALGNAVNLASRVQGASKYLQAGVLITGATAGKLDGSLPLRRLGRVRVINIAEPVEIFELASPGTPHWDQRREEYESALKEFEQQRCSAAAGILKELLARDPDDGPAQVLLSRTLASMDGADFDPIWHLPGK